MGLKDYAKFPPQAGVLKKQGTFERRRPSSTSDDVRKSESDAPETRPPPNRTNPFDARAPLDSWKPPPTPVEKGKKNRSGDPDPDPDPDRGKPAKKYPGEFYTAARGSQEVADDDPVPQQMGRPHAPLEKVRLRGICISMSWEEQQIIDKYVQARHLNRSDWARSIIFEAMGRKIPPRPDVLPSLRKKKT